MTSFLGLAAALALAACAGDAPTSGPASVCDREVESDPNVEALRVRALANPQAAFLVQHDLEYARKQAMTACLRRHGLLPPGGGVEAVRPQG